MFKKNLRILSVNASSNTTVRVEFNQPLNPSIDTSNIKITSSSNSIPDPIILQAQVSSTFITIDVSPLTSITTYAVIFTSTSDIVFSSADNDYLLIEDGIANKQIFVSPVEEDNLVKQYFTNYLSDSVYNTENGTIVNNYLNVLTSLFSKALYDARQIKNENYLSLQIKNEKKIRGKGAFDHLNEECAYEILRVGKTESGSTAELSISVDDFTANPISLIANGTTEDLIISSSTQMGTFNINDLIINLSNKPVIKLKSIIFNYTDGYAPYQYDITKYGYQILESKYDTLYAFKYNLLSNSQIKINDKILEDTNFSINHIFKVSVAYEYKDLGKIIDISSLSITSVSNSGREVIDSLENTFNLKHGPVVDDNGDIGTIGDISFINQNTLAELEEPHPAFINEIKFRLDLMPSVPGQYSIDYENATVYVYGTDSNKDGTGATPPITIYNYRDVYKQDIDWSLESDLYDVVALPSGRLLDNAGIINFTYEQVLVQDVDYKSSVHEEILDERIDNRLLALNIISTENSPITNVFRIFNETTGEIYKVTRWNDNKIYFSYNTPPNIAQILGERVSFEDVNNEVMFVTEVTTISPTFQIFKIQLENKQIISKSEDCIGSFGNSSISLSDNNIFKEEVYFDNNDTVNINLSRVNVAGKFAIDYINGIIYLGVSDRQSFDVGTVSYKKNSIVPESPHVTTISDIFYRINTLSGKNKSFDYESFSDGFIYPVGLDFADEQFLNNDIAYPYLILYQQIGSFVDSQFVNQVNNEIKFIRGLYEYNDLQNNKAPLNFAESTDFSGKSISVNPITNNEYHSIQFDGTNYFINLNTGLFYKSSNITLNISVIRLSDSNQLWSGTGQVVLGEMIKIILPNINSPQSGDSVIVNYSYSINDLSHVSIDYNKGELYTDYNALIDEIIVSYEYGSNDIDFRQSIALDEGDTYYVSYKVGSLRDSLLKNFGSLIDVSDLNSFDINFSRERYRDALTAAMHSFSTGPTAKAIENIGEIISHLPAKVNEFVFENWSLGTGSLYLEDFKTKGDVSLSPSKYDDGLLIDHAGQEVTIPSISNIKLDGGTISAWVKPNWDGLDNLAKLDIYPSLDGYNMSHLDIYVGALEYHPTLLTDENTGQKFFSIDKNSQVDGIPNKKKNGLYLYYSRDISNNFNRWYMDIVDGYGNDGVNKNYSIKIVAKDGNFYDVKPNSIVTSGNLITTTTPQYIKLNITDNDINEGITFVSDLQHYIFDLGEKNKNRLSLFKDESGYLNLRVLDKFSNQYIVQADVSAWRAGDLHYVSTAWKIDSKMGKDELHLFIDGFEVANIIKYGNKVNPYLHQKYNTLGVEEVLGSVNKNIISGIDLSTVFGSNQVTSSMNFSQYGIVIGDSLYIEENGFDPNGYTITNVNGNTLTLSSTMPFTINNGKFNANKTSFDILTEVDIFPNFYVSTLSSFLDSNDGYVVNNSNTFNSLGTNFITQAVNVGDVLKIHNANFEFHYNILKVNTHSLLVDGYYTSNTGGLNFSIYHDSEVEMPGLRSVTPAYEISRSNDGYYSNVLTLKDKVKVNDLVLLKSLGLNHRLVNRKYYVWGNSNNVLKTKLPTPISLDEVKFKKVILPSTLIGPSNSSLVGGVFVSNNLIPDSVTNLETGRTLDISVQGENIDFGTPVTVSIDGYAINNSGSMYHIVETISFLEQSTISSVNLYSGFNNIKVHSKPLNSSRTSAIVEVKEKYSLTVLENSSIYSNTEPSSESIVRYSYQAAVGNKLSSNGSSLSLRDNVTFFSDALLGNDIKIYYPTSAIGIYKINGISDDHHELFLDINSPFTSFTDGYYEVLNTTSARNGLQNGYFTFEYKDEPGTPFNLTQGLYQLEYHTYLNVPFDLTHSVIYIGTDVDANNSLYGTISELESLNVQLTDTRVGETIPTNQRSITKNFNSVKPIKADSSTLILSKLNSLPPKNDAGVYKFAENNYMQAGNTINDNFGQSLYITDTPIIIDNDGILNYKKEGTLEFWVNPLFDASNDPNYRFYFDASGIVQESNTSVSYTEILLSGTASEVMSVKVKIGNDNINYFAGGQIIDNGSKLILHKPLPNYNTEVIVSYVPKKLNGDRISIFKDPYGYINFNIRANNIDYQVRTPIYWIRDSWHRVKATFKVNSGTINDEIHLFVDGYEHGNVLYGDNLIFDQGVVYGSSFAGPNSTKYAIKFNDPINQLYIGSDINSGNHAYCLMDNFRISNIARPTYQPFGEPLDPNYNSNINMVYPITQDLNTTLLLNFNTILSKNEDFAILNNASSGSSDFSINILDSFDIIDNNSKVKQVLEALIESFKPANSRAFINYI